MTFARPRLAPGDATQPAAHARLAAKGPRVSPRGEKGFLRHVVGIGVITEQPPEKRPYGLLVSVDERVEREFRAAADRSEQRRVVIGHRSGAWDAPTSWAATLAAKNRATRVATTTPGLVSPNSE